MADFPHFFVRDSRTPANYTSTVTGGGNRQSPPRPERRTHADKLLSDLERAERNAKARQQTEPIREGLQFIPMRFAEGSEFDLELKRLESEQLGIRIISAREVGGRKEYIVAVPDSQVSRLADKFRAYRDEDTKKGKPKNEPLASSVSTIEAAELSDYWTEAGETLPPPTEALWWEIWLEDRPAEPAFDVEQWFRDTAATQGITVSRERVRFPERVVILAHATLAQWEQFPGLLRHLAEFRRANIVAGEFTRLTPAGQAEYINNLLGRTQYADDSAVRVCLLDTGVDRGHPLLESALAPEQLQSWRDEWGSDDHEGHGTQMAGVCLFGPLSEPLYGEHAVVLRHRLESVKILPRQGANDPPDYGPISVGSMALAETAAPNSKRVFCLAVTAPGDDQWRPTLWSATLDQACAGALDGFRRLLVVSAGNLREDIGKNYPTENHVSSVEDPAQSWNALTVGAYTNLVWLAEQGLEGYTPIAAPGSLSPASRTSLCWGDEPWPYKPDVVFEGGNYAKDRNDFVTSAEDLEILTTQSSSDSTALLGTIRDTSAATAQAARMAAILQAEYPDYWPESIRGLIVHSAEWTARMLEEFPRGNLQVRKNRLRDYGMGVPNLSRARRSAEGFATMVIQDQLQPFQMDGGENSTHQMHLHELPIPREVLEGLGDLPVRMRVTLSYFIEPNPPRRGYVAQYQYASHGLRFSVRRPEETRERLLTRLSREFWDVAEDGKRTRPTDNASDERAWDLGPEKVSVRGSIHSDAWNGTAAQLASSNMIAVYPVTGWWRYRKDREIVERVAPYSLIVTVSTEDTSVNLYAAIETEIATRIASRVATTIPAT
jgi:subtilisin family serine protease